MALDDRVRVVIVADEVQHGHQQHRQRLAEIDELTRAGMIQDRSAAPAGPPRSPRCSRRS